MSSSTAYSAALERLRDCGRRMAQVKWSPTPLRKELNAVSASAQKLAKRLRVVPMESPGEVSTLAAQLADRVEFGRTWSGIEDACGASYRSALSALRTLPAALTASWVDFDRSAVDHDVVQACNDVSQALLQIVAAARAVESALPKANERPVQRYVALVFVYLRREHGLTRPSTYVAGADVAELDGLLHEAGVGGKYVTNNDTLELTHTLLVNALKLYDPHMRPPGYADIA